MAKRILLIETGGTICMRLGPDGLLPQDGILASALQDMAADMSITTRRIGPLRDSAEMGPPEWNAILDLVDAWDGDGVLITHGTDTMAYTGAALAAALPDPAIPVILCGSMEPLGAQGSDAEGNLQLALDTVTGGKGGHFLTFAGKVMPAGSLVKHHSSQPDAFRSTGGGLARPVPIARRFAPCNVAIITVTPGMAKASAALAAMLAHLDGAVLRVFGAGTIMQEPALIDVFAKAVARGCVIMAISQCEQGGLHVGAYAAGAAIWAAGVENGGDLTAERALAEVMLRCSARPT